LFSSSANTAESQSRILDADYAEQTMLLARRQILQSAGQQMLAISNASARQVLSLLS
jgi:flagellin